MSRHGRRLPCAAADPAGVLRWTTLLAAVIVAAWVGAVITAAPALAHDFRPAYFGAQVAADGGLTVHWSVPTSVDPEQVPVWGAPCVAEAGDAAPSGTSLRRTIAVRCGDAATARAGLPTLDADLVVRVDYPDGTHVTDVRPYVSGVVDIPLAGSAPPSLGAEAGADEAPGWVGYGVLGVEHILFGWDHLVFVLLVVLASIRGGGRVGRGVLAAVTGFTVGHSVTLCAAALGVASLPGPPVEVCIAISIVYMARDVLVGHAGRVARWHVTALFGLLHGFGFAGALAEIGLPEQGLVAALLAFNLGVELGQLAFVAVLLGIWAVTARGLPTALKRPASRVAPALAYASGALGVFWTLERVVGFW